MHSESWVMGGAMSRPLFPLSSSIVVKSLIDAHRDGLRFRVIVVDSRPKLEGKNEVKFWSDELRPIVMRWM